MPRTLRLLCSLGLLGLVGGTGAPSAFAQFAPSAWLEAEAVPAGPVAERAGRGEVEYAYDDGAAFLNIGPPSSFDPDMLWGNYFLTEPGGEVITEISVAFGSTFPSLEDGPVTFWLLDDPDMDFDPRNATALTSVDATPDLFGNVFFSVEIEPTTVSGAFFVGASALLQGGEDRPARVDTDARADRSWFFYAPDIAEVIDSLGTAPFGTRMDSTEVVPFPGAFMVRARGEAMPVANEADAAPIGVSIESAFPNPFGAASTIAYRLEAPQPVVIDVVDVLGRRVALLADGEQAAGHHTATWDARGVAAGVYLVRLRAGAEVHTHRLVRR